MVYFYMVMLFLDLLMNVYTLLYIEIIGDISSLLSQSCDIKSNLLVECFVISKRL